MTRLNTRPCIHQNTRISETTRIVVFHTKSNRTANAPCHHTQDQAGTRPADVSATRPADVTATPRPADVTATPRPAYVTATPRPADGTAAPRPADVTATRSADITARRAREQPPLMEHADLILSTRLRAESSFHNTMRSN